MDAMARTRAQDFEDKRRAILDSAARVFAAQGMSKASMAQIAVEAQVSKALLYHYYPGKDALIFAIISTHLKELDTVIAAADDPGEPADQRLRRMIAAAIHLYRGADDRHQVQLNAIGALAKEERETIYVIERRIVRRFSSVLGALNPRLAAEDRPLLKPLTMSVFGMMNWMYTWFRDDGALTREDYAEVAAALVLGGIGAVR